MTRSAVLRKLLPCLFSYIRGRDKRQQLRVAIRRLLGAAAVEALEQRYPEADSAEAFLAGLGSRRCVQAWTCGLASSDAGLRLAFSIKKAASLPLGKAVPREFLYPSVILSFGAVAKELTEAFAAALGSEKFRKKPGKNNEQPQYRWETGELSLVRGSCFVYLAFGKRLGIETGQDQKCSMVVRQFPTLRQEQWYRSVEAEEYRRFTDFVEAWGHQFKPGKKVGKVWREQYKLRLGAEAPPAQFSGLSSGVDAAVEKHRQAGIPLELSPPRRAPETSADRKQQRALERYTLANAVLFFPPKEKELP